MSNLLDNILKAVIDTSFEYIAGVTYNEQEKRYE